MYILVVRCRVRLYNVLRGDAVFRVLAIPESSTTDGLELIGDLEV